jgi:thiol-disulfide isomerase/thioredoxin
MKPLRSALMLTLILGSFVAVAAFSHATPADDAVTLTKVKYSDFLAKVAEKKAKLTVVDAWATWCGPCKENFPHLIEMHKKYASKGLAVVSLSLDDPEKPKKFAEALEFLKSMKATFPNLLLDETTEDSFEKLKIGAIPAVFLFGPDGKEIKRFTLEDASNPFTYEQVEKTIQSMLGESK